MCLFTCCAFRAVHLDLVPDMTGVAFLRCLKRFVSRRGIPQRFLSDNAKTFKFAAKSLRAMLKQSDVQQYLADRKIQWTFNVEKAPWWGGVFERMIKATKRCLRKVVGRAKLYHDELSTVLVEIEAVVNSRPLTYLSPEDLDEPITPSHFLCGRRVLSLPDSLHEDDMKEYLPAQPDLSRRLKHLNVMLNQFWKRWRGEYLLELRNAHRWHGGNPDATAPSVGDIVLVEDEDQPRGLWILAKVISLIVGKDGHPRGAVLRVSSGSGTLQRPLQRLYPLETAAEYELESKPGDPSEACPETAREEAIQSQTGTEPPQSRPQRAAAAEARDRLAAYAILESNS